MLHRWRKAGEASHLWSWVHLPRVEDQRAGELAVEMLKSVRLAKVEKISISVESLSQDLLQAVLNHKGLKEMELSTKGGYGYGGIPCELDRQLLIEVLTKMESLVLQTNALQKTELTSLLTAMAEVSSVKELYIWAESSEEIRRKISERNRGRKGWRGMLAPRIPHYLWCVPTALLVSALTKLTTFQLAHSVLTADQMIGLLEKISDSSLQSFSLVRASWLWGRVDLTPLVNLKEVCLVGGLNWEALVNFFAALSSSTNLRKLGFDLTDGFRDRAMEVIAKGLNFLEEVKIKANPLQVSTLFGLNSVNPLKSWGIFAYLRRLIWQLFGSLATTFRGISISRTHINKISST